MFPQEQKSAEDLSGVGRRKIKSWLPWACRRCSVNASALPHALGADSQGIIASLWGGASMPDPQGESETQVSRFYAPTKCLAIRDSETKERRKKHAGQFMTCAFCKGAIRQHSTALQFLQISRKSSL